MIAPLPVSALKPGSVHRPLPGIETDIVDSEGQAVPPGKKGGLVLTRPWPSMLLGLYRKAELYEAAYWNARKHYRTGDTASRDEDGLIWVHGRNDGVMNIAGHRIGCAEVEKALMTHKAVAEAAVIGVPDKIKGEVGRAFIVLRPDFAVLDDRDEIIRMLKAHLRKEIGPVAVVRGMDFVDSLPKTGGAPDRAALRKKMEETEG